MKRATGNQPRAGAFLHLPALSSAVLSLAIAVGAQSISIRTGKTPSGLAYDIRGKGPVVVLITGANLDRRMWRKEIAWLASDFTVLEYDLRAHGASDVPKTPFSHSSDLLDLLDELSIARATLIGLSAGSTAAIDVALQAPGRVERLVLAAPAISGYVPKEMPAFFRDLAEALKAADYRKAGDVLLSTPVFAAPPASRALVRQMVLENDRLWTVPRELLKAPPRAALDHLESITAPTLVLVGENDMAAQHDQADLLAKRIPGAKLVKVAGGGHLLNLTSPERFRSLVSGFLKDALKAPHQ